MIWFVVFATAAGLTALLFYKGAPLKYDRADFQTRLPQQQPPTDAGKPPADPS